MEVDEPVEIQGETSTKKMTNKEPTSEINEGRLVRLTRRIEEMEMELELWRLMKREMELDYLVEIQGETPTNKILVMRQLRRYWEEMEMELVRQTRGVMEEMELERVMEEMEMEMEMQIQMEMEMEMDDWVEITPAKKKKNKKKKTRRRILWGGLTSRESIRETNDEILKVKILLNQYRFVPHADGDKIPSEFLKDNAEWIEEPDSHCRRPAWAVVSWSDSKSKFRVSSLEEAAKEDDEVDMLGMFPYQCGLGKVTSNTTTLFSSQILSIGGLYPLMGWAPLSKVHAFNIKSKIWSKFPSLNTGRCYHAVVSVSDSVYVFGTANCGPRKCIIPPDQWGERFDIQGDKWIYLPKPPKLLYKLYHPQAHAVYHNCQFFYYISKKKRRIRVAPKQNLILFLLPEPGSPISVFNCTTNTWLPDMYPRSPDDHEAPPIFPYLPRARMNQDRLVVIHGVLIWRHLEYIHGYDLIHGRYMESLYRIPRNQTQQILGYDRVQPNDPPMFLIQPGVQKLLMFFQTNFDTFVIHCHKFRIQTGASFGLIHECYSRLSTEFKSTKQEALLAVLLL